MLYENQYKVQTDWGWMTLDEGSYRDYLAGKLWINTARRSENEQTIHPEPKVRSYAASREAIQLRDLAAKQGICSLLRQLLRGGEMEAPYRTRMSRVKIEEMCLRPRAENCLMRAGADTFGKLHELMSSGSGLKSVRNLGTKSEEEIRQAFFAACYSRLSSEEQALFWQELIQNIEVYRERSTMGSDKAKLRWNPKADIARAISRLNEVRSDMGYGPVPDEFKTRLKTELDKPNENGKKTIESIASELSDIVAAESQYAIPNFITKVEKWFKDGNGYYDWGSLRYFMYEYEFQLKEKTGTEKITWEMFSKSEKDKVSIEHILPQTPTKYYWRNMFRQYSEAEIAQMSGALGNLLPLSLSINIALQNDSFPDKKHAKDGGCGRRGYEDGSHSEIEVAKNENWSAKNIFSRSKKLIGFLATRWNIHLTEEQEKNLIFVNFAGEDREPCPELPEEDAIIPSSEPAVQKHSLSSTAEVLVEWCEEQRKNGNIYFDRSHSSNSYIRFTTAGMDRFIPRQQNLISGWNSNDFYFYEINNNNDGFRLILSICSINAPYDLMKEFYQLIDFYKPRRSKPGWEWKRLHSTTYATYASNTTKELIWQQLDKMLSEMMALEEALFNTRNGDREQ